MNHLRTRLEWWDVTDIMTLNEIVDYCDQERVSVRVDAGRMKIPVFIDEEVC